MSKNSSPTPLCVPRNRQRRHKLGKGCEKNSPILANEEKTPAVKMADTEGRETGLPKIGQAASVMRWAMKWVAVNYILEQSRPSIMLLGTDRAQARLFIFVVRFGSSL